MIRNVIIFIKAPRLGLVKSRLSADIGFQDSWCFYRRAVRRLIFRIALDPHWRCFLAVTPDGFVGNEPFWPIKCHVFKQGAGDLEKRMRRVIENLLPEPTILIGGDIPDIRNHHIAAAFKALGEYDAVFGPSTDGGYWLVGVSRRAVLLNLFKGVRWSTSDTLSDTLANLQRGGFSANQSGEPVN